MFDECTTMIVPADDAVDMLSRLLGDLQHQGFLAKDELEMEPDQLEGVTVPSHAKSLVDALGAGAVPTGKAVELIGSLRASTPTASAPPSAQLFLYFRLTAPAQLPEAHRTGYKQTLGTPPEDPGDFYVVHPYECWLTLDLADPAGTWLVNTLKSHSSASTTVLPGSFRRLVPGTLENKDVPANALCLRTTTENARYLAFALSRMECLSRAPIYFHVEET